MEDKSLAQQLEAFGLNPTEAAIYLHLVSKQAKTILEIARDLGLPRTSVYDNAIKLAEKGLVQKIVTFKSQKLQAYPLSILQASLDKQKAQVDELQQKLTTLEMSLAHTLATPTSTEVRYYYGQKGFQQMMWNALKAKDGIVGYSQFGRLEVVGNEFNKKLTEETIQRGITDRVITNPKYAQEYLTIYTDLDRRKLYQTTRVIDAKRLHISGDTSIYNNIFNVAYWKQGEVVGVEIENAELVKTQRDIFELIWAIAEPVESYLKPTKTA